MAQSRHNNFAIESPKLTFSPRAIVVWTWYIGNDLADPAGEMFDVGQLPWNNTLEAGLVKYRTFTNRSPMHQWWQARQSRRTNPGGEVMVRALPNGQPILFLPGHDWWGSQSKQAIEQHANFHKNERTLEAMKRLVAEKGLKLVVVVLPTKGGITAGLWKAEIHALQTQRRRDLRWPCSPPADECMCIAWTQNRTSLSRDVGCSVRRKTCFGGAMTPI